MTISTWGRLFKCEVWEEMDSVVSVSDVRMRLRLRSSVSALDARPVSVSPLKSFFGAPFWILIQGTPILNSHSVG